MGFRKQWGDSTCYNGGATGMEVNFNSEYTIYDFHLFPNYPNPFNSHMIIFYKLPNRGQIKLTIYDILWREVITLVDKVQSFGLHRIIWDGKDKKGGDVSSGMYFYHLQYEGVFQKARKMILVRLDFNLNHYNNNHNLKRRK